MLFKIDCQNIKQSKQLTLTNEAKYPILVRIIDNNSCIIIPSFSLLKLHEKKKFQILSKLPSKPESLIKIEAIEFDETQLNTFSIPPFWSERNQGFLETQSQSLSLHTDIFESNEFAFENKSPSINQTFHDYSQIQNNSIENSITQNIQQNKQNIYDYDNQSNSNQSIKSQQSLQVICTNKISDENKFDQSYQQNRKHSMSSFESYGYISTTQTQPQILKMPKDLNNFLDQIDSSNNPFLIQIPSQQQSQSHSQFNCLDNVQQDISISETTSIQRFHNTKQSEPQLSKSQFNEKSKFRISQNLINHPKSTIYNSQNLSKNKLLENQLLKQISQLQLNKEELQQELKKLEFKIIFNCKNVNKINHQHFQIWHILLTSVLCLLIGSFMKKLVPQF